MTNPNLGKIARIWLAVENLFSLPKGKTSRCPAILGGMITYKLLNSRLNSCFSE